MSEPVPRLPGRRQRNRFLPSSFSRVDEPVAIIGMSGSFPGASDIDALWQNLLAGRDSIGEIPADRWDWSRFGDAERIRHAGVLGGLDDRVPYVHHHQAMMRIHDLRLARRYAKKQRIKMRS